MCGLLTGTTHRRCDRDVDRYDIDDVTGMIGCVWSVDKYNT